MRSNTERKPCVDHIDNDKSNNNIQNLRFATYSQNGMTSLKFISNTGVNGVSLIKATRKWRTSVSVDGKTKIWVTSTLSLKQRRLELRQLKNTTVHTQTHRQINSYIFIKNKT